jgi:hypothetical protein
MIEQYNLSFLNLDKIKEVLLKTELAEHGLLSDGKSSFNYGMPILMHPELQSLSTILKQYVILYCKNYNVPSLKFINSWFNITNSGNKLKEHHHGEIGLSGAFYVSVGEHSVPLIFSNTQIKPYCGLLILFPSSFTHYTEEEQEQRIVISFNTDYL